MIAVLRYKEESPGRTFGIQKAIKRDAMSARVPPKKKGAEAQSPPQDPAPCQSKPAMNEAGNAKMPMVAL